MNREFTREDFVILLDEVGVRGLVNHPQRVAFEHGEGDIPLADLGIDSLALMEMGIGIEERVGVSLSPNSLGKHLTLGSLWRHISEDDAD